MNGDPLQDPGEFERVRFVSMRGRERARRDLGSGAVTRAKRGRRPISFAVARRIALALPGAAEGTSYRTPAFRVGGRLFARFREDGETLVVRIDFDTREALLQANPDAYFLTDHYRPHPWILVRLSAVKRDELAARLTEAWRLVAPRRLASARA